MQLNKRIITLTIASILAGVAGGTAAAEASPCKRLILFPDGKPAAGVKVIICKTDGPPVSMFTDQKGVCSGQTSYQWKQNQDGSHEIADVKVLVDAPGMALVVSNIGKWLPLEKDEPSPLRLVPAERGYVFSGKVLSAQKKPVAAAVIVLNDVTEGSMAPWRFSQEKIGIAELKTRSLPDGSFKLRSLILDTNDPFPGGMGGIIFKSVSASANIGGDAYSGKSSGSSSALSEINLSCTSKSPPK